MMWATIIADASYCPHTGASGYAFWIASARRKFGKDGPFKVPLESNIVAEMMAMLNALNYAVAKEVVLKSEGVLIQSDCQPAIDTFQNKRKRLSPNEEFLIKWFNNFVKEHSLTIRFKHVKGHSEETGNRFVVNHICDRKAKRAMRSLRTKYEQTGEE